MRIGGMLSPVTANPLAIVQPLRRLIPQTRRDLRLASGIVLFTYVTLHLSCHALGLVSLDVAERALRLTVLLWHSPPGTLLLYGAAAVHISLALLAVYDRRTLRMPPLQALRIVLGLTMPITLIGHFIVTRYAFERFALPAEYSRVVAGLWASGASGLVARPPRAGLDPRLPRSALRVRPSARLAALQARSLRRRAAAAGARGRRLRHHGPRARGAAHRARAAGRRGRRQSVGRAASARAKARCWCTSRSSPGSASAAAGAASPSAGTARWCGSRIRIAP